MADANSTQFIVEDNDKDHQFCIIHLAVNMLT